MYKMYQPLVCLRNFALESNFLCAFHRTVYKSRYSRYDLNKIVQLNRENKLLFGPVLTEKDLKPKKRKTKKKKSASNGISSILEEAKSETISPEQLDEIIATPAKQSQGKKEKKTKKTDSESLKREQKAPSKSKTKELEPSLPVFEFLLNFPLNEQFDSESEECVGFNSQVEQMSLRNVPTVSRILSQTQSEMAKFFLQRWREKSIEELGKEAFYQKQEEIKRDGINLHACVQQYLSGKDVSDIQIQPRTEGYWQSLQTAFEKIGDIKSTETEVKHPQLLYRGTYDCVAVFRDTLCVIDWKTSQKPKPLLSNTFDNPLQVAAYLGAVNANTDINQQFGPVTGAAIVIAYPWGEPAHIHMMSQEQCEESWKQWLTRLNQYWNQLAKEKVAMY